MDEMMFSLSFPNVTGKNKTKEGKKKKSSCFQLSAFSLVGVISACL
jgi:hypothetical protein